MSKSFYKRNLDDLVVDLEDEKNPKKSHDLRIEWAEADGSLKAREDGEPVQFEKPTAVNKHTRCGYQMSAEYGFMTEKEFLREFKLPCSAVSIKPVKRMCEEANRMLSGIVFKPEAGDDLRFRMLEYFYDVYALTDEYTVVPTNRLREKEPSDVFSGMCRESAVDHPAAFNVSEHRVISLSG